MNTFDSISITNLAIGYGQRSILKGLNLRLRKGELTALLGPNGAGKSTLIRSISAVQRSLEGEVQLKGKPLSSFSQKELAKELSLVLTDSQAPANLNVFALVALGRFPYTSWLGTISKKDEELINWALASTGMLAFANRQLGQLSDGERQKVMIARALAQETDVLILDEPTAHLDTPNRIEIFYLLKELTRKTGKTILVSIHDLETAMSYADRLWLIEDQKVHVGIPEDLVLKGHLARAFQTKSVQFNYTKGRFERTGQDKDQKIKLTGDDTLCFWLQHALERQGFYVTDKALIEVIAQGTQLAPEMRLSGVSESFNTIEKLLNKLNGDNN